MRLEAVTTCIKYSDFLGHAIDHNRSMFNHWVIVTTPEDVNTQALCEYYHIECVKLSNLGIERGQFQKGVAINAGLRRLSLSDWVVHLDADIVLPPHTRPILDRIVPSLDPATIYGIDRHNIIGFNKWQKHLRRPKLQHEAEIYLHADAYPVATRFVPEYVYSPIGFFQLWNPRGSGVYSYPIQHTTAARTDMLFAEKFPRSRRAMLPEIIAYHLESQLAPLGTNWSGRRTIPFKYEPWWRRMRHRRCHHHHHDPDPDPYNPRPDDDDDER